MKNNLSPYRKSSLNFRERPFNVGGYESNGKIYRFRNRTGAGAKLNRDRVNRSFKKGLRQYYKKEIQQELQNK